MDVQVAETTAALHEAKSRVEIMMITIESLTEELAKASHEISEMEDKPGADLAEDLFEVAALQQRFHEMSKHFKATKTVDEESRQRPIEGPSGPDSRVNLEEGGGTHSQIRAVMGKLDQMLAARLVKGPSGSMNDEFATAPSSIGARISEIKSVNLRARDFSQYLQDDASSLAPLWDFTLDQAAKQGLPGPALFLRTYADAWPMPLSDTLKVMQRLRIAIPDGATEQEEQAAILGSAEFLRRTCGAPGAMLRSRLRTT